MEWPFNLADVSWRKINTNLNGFFGFVNLVSAKNAKTEIAADENTANEIY